METAPPPFCFWHLNPCKAKPNQEMQHISRIEPGQCFPPHISARAVISDRSLCRDSTKSSRFRLVPRHMLALVAQHLSNVKHQSLQLSELVLTCCAQHHCGPVKYLHEPLELQWLRSLWGAWNVINPDSARVAEVFLFLNRGILNRGMQGVRKNEKMQGWGRFEVWKCRQHETCWTCWRLVLMSIFLYKLTDWSLDPKSEHGFTAHRTCALASKWNGHCSQPYLPVSGTYSKAKQTASQDLTEKTAGSDRFHVICWHL